MQQQTVRKVTRAPRTLADVFEEERQYQQPPPSDPWATKAGAAALHRRLNAAAAVRREQEIREAEREAASAADLYHAALLERLRQRKGA
jgi:hypothetical protein